jgi:hypothetical protein
VVVECRETDERLPAESEGGNTMAHPLLRFGGSSLNNVAKARKSLAGFGRQPCQG